MRFLRLSCAVLSLLALIPNPARAAVPLQVSIESQTNVACNGGSNGAATAVASGGSGVYTYSWSPSGATTATITGLTAQTYTVTADDGSTTATATVTITQPPALTLTPNPTTNVSCNGGANGAASVSASGGTPSYVYNWTPGNPNGDGTASVTGLSAGVYTVTVTDANTCQATQTFVVTQPPAITLTAASQTNVACNGGVTGAATVNPASGGTGIFTYNWTPGNPSGDGTTSVTGLAAQVYTVTASDSNNCSATQTFAITQPPAISFTKATQTNIACKGQSTGAASVNNASGGVGGFLYDWAPGTPTGDGTTSVTGLTAQTYTATVTDANSCTATQTFAITEPAEALTATSSQTNIACNGNSTGSATVGGSGGTPAYTYLWSNGATTATIDSLVAGTYVATVTDANSCTANHTFVITQPTTITLGSGGQTNVACNGQTNGSATVTASGGAGGYTYAWSNGDTTATASGLAVGTYTATVTDANSCSANRTFAISEPAALSASLQSKTNVSCNGGTNGAVSVTASGGTGAYSYDWAPGTPTGDGSASASALTAGTYTLTLTDANSCALTQTYEITEPTALLANGSSVGVSAIGICDGSAGVAPSGGTGPYEVSWSPGGATTQTLTAQCASTLTATVTDANSCTATFTATLSAPNADLAIGIVGPSAAVNAGAQASYTITASTDTNAPSPVVSGSVPTSMGFVSLDAPTGWTCTTPAVGGSGAWSCSGPTLTSGSPAAFTLVTTVDELFGHGDITVTTMIAAAVNDGAAGNNSAQATTAVLSPGHLVATKTAVFTAPNQIVYTIVVRNTGPAAALDITGSAELTDAVPATLEVDTVSATVGTAAAVGNDVTWNGTLKVNETATLTINTKVASATTPGSTIANQATLHYDGNGDGTAESSEGSSPDGVTPAATEVTLPAPNDDLTVVVVDMAVPADLPTVDLPAGDLPASESDLSQSDLAHHPDLTPKATYTVSGGGFGCAAGGDPLAATSLGLFCLGAMLVLRRARR